MVVFEAASDGRPGLATLEASDCDALTRLFHQLSPGSAYRRFFSPLPKPDQLLASVLRIDRYQRVAIAAVEGGELVGVAEYSREPDARRACMAILIADAWQRQGIGTRLVAALADRAAAEGIEEFAVAIQGDNFGALRLLKRVAPGARLTFSAGVGEAVIPLSRTGTTEFGCRTDSNRSIEPSQARRPQDV